jgi:hypothetical protein
VEQYAKYLLHHHDCKKNPAPTPQPNRVYESRQETVQFPEEAELHTTQLAASPF